MERGFRRFITYVFSGAIDLAEFFALIAIAVMRWGPIGLVSAFAVGELGRVTSENALSQHVTLLIGIVTVLGIALDIARIILMERALPDVDARSSSQEDNAGEAAKRIASELRSRRAYFNRAAIVLFFSSVIVGAVVYLIAQAFSLSNAATWSIFTTLAAFVVVAWWQNQSRIGSPPVFIAASEEDNAALKKATELARLFEDKAKQREALITLYGQTISRAQNNIDWYTRNARLKKRRAQIIRLLSLVLLGVGGVTPVVIDVFTPSGGTPPVSPSVATLIIAAGTGLVALDRFWGYSTAWMRFLTTEMQLKNSLETFEFDWHARMNRFDANEPGIIDEMINRCATLRDKVNSVVQEETKTWVEEFQASLRAYDSNLKAASDASQPGAVNITVTNGSDPAYAKGWEILLDDRPMLARQGTTHAAIRNIPDGHHIISVREKGEKSTHHEQVIMVGPGQICDVTLVLPTPSSNPPKP